MGLDLTLPFDYICDECAVARGAHWPKLHVATIHSDTCLYCDDQKALANIGDWEWPDGKSRGMRD